MTAKIKLNAASGGGSFSLQAPSSSANNRVITLPDVADGTLLTSTNETADYVKLQQADSSSSAAQLNFDNLDVTTYKFFDFIGTFKPVTDAEHFRMRFRTGGGSGADLTASDYAYGFTVPYPTNNTGATATQAQNQMLLSTTVGNHASEAISINMRICFADSSAPTTPKYVMNFVTWMGTYREQGNGSRHVNGQGHFYHSGTYPTGFSVSFTSGSIDEYSYCLYGLTR